MSFRGGFVFHADVQGNLLRPRIYFRFGLAPPTVANICNVAGTRDRPNFHTTDEMEKKHTHTQTADGSAKIIRVHILPEKKIL